MKEFEIRQLIENYYDIQKIRVETFNRIVCWVRENSEKIIKSLEELVKSQRVSKPHFIDVSHNRSETHMKNALELLKNKKYSKFVKRFVLSHWGLESQRTYASHILSEPQKKRASQLHGEYQLHHALFKDIEDLIWFHNRLLETEKELKKRIDLWSKGHPLRKKFLRYVKGIGPILASGLIAWLSKPILKASYVSQIWSYCGLAPGQERRKGKKVNYNPRLKTFCWKIGESFILSLIHI